MKYLILALSLGLTACGESEPIAEAPAKTTKPARVIVKALPEKDMVEMLEKYGDKLSADEKVQYCEHLLKIAPKNQKYITALALYENERTKEITRAQTKAGLR